MFRIKLSKAASNNEPGTTAIGARERRLLSETSHIEEELVPGFVRPILFIVGAFLVVFLIWAAITEMKEVARAPGEIIPNGNIKVVQHLEGGIVAQIPVDERTLVEPGQVVLRLDGTQLRAELQAMQTRLDGLRLRAERLRSFASGQRPKFSSNANAESPLAPGQELIFQAQTAARSSSLDILDRQIEQRTKRIEQLNQLLGVAQEQLRITSEIAETREDLARRRLINKTVLWETRRAKLASQGEVARLKEEVSIVSQELAETRSRRVDVVNQLRREAITEYGAVSAEISEVSEQVKRLQDRVYRLDIRSPIRGWVHDMRARTLGQVIQPGALVMQIVSDKIVVEAEVQISNRDIGFVKVGQPVKLRVTTFDYARYGIAKGFLKRISASSVVSPEGRPYYKGLVELNNEFVGNVPAKHPMQPGMTVEAEILTGEKTLLQYLSKPLIDVLTLSFHER